MPQGEPLSFLSGGGLCGELVRSIDWAKTPLGASQLWPGSLKTTVGIILHSRHPMFLWWGPELIQFYNDAYLPSFGVGKHPAAMGQRGRDCWQEIWPIIGPQIDDVMGSEKASWNQDQLVPIFRNGRIEEVYWTYGYSPVYGDDGGVGGTLVVCTETTEQVTARRALEAAGRAKDEFLATMSHELRTPLNAILGWAKILKDDPRDTAKLEKGLAVIERNAVSQARLVSDLLDVSRIVSGKLHLAMRRVEVAAAIHAAVEVVRPAADAKRVRLEVRVDAELETMVADPDRLQQILWNLLTNAVRFTPAHGAVTISAVRAESLVRVTVEDTGAGISPEHLPHIFERFRQADASTTRAHGGLGLGLAIVRYLAEAHGGAVAARSEGAGKGASFTVALPIQASPKADASAETATENAAPRSASGERATLHDVRALVVDDDEDSLDLLREVLEGAGASFTGAKSAQEALEADGPFDVVISDIGMPEMDGYALMRHIRSWESGATVPAIALTAYARTEDAERALRSGYQEHLTKPVDAGELLDAVKRWTQMRPGREPG